MVPTGARAPNPLPEAPHPDRNEAPQAEIGLGPWVTSDNTLKTLKFLAVTFGMSGTRTPGPPTEPRVWKSAAALAIGRQVRRSARRRHRRARVRATPQQPPPPVGPIKAGGQRRQNSG